MTTLVKPKTLFIGLVLLCVLAIWLSLALGPVSLPLLDTLKAALRLMGLPIKAQGLEQAELILGQIRLPRTLLGLAVGGVLALSGVAMQGLFAIPWLIRAWWEFPAVPRWGRRWRLSAVRFSAVCRMRSGRICCHSAHSWGAWV